MFRRYEPGLNTTFALRTDEEMLKPVIRWVGGKSQLLPHIMQRLPGDIDTYYEPFVGGGAVMLAVIAERRARRIVAADMNFELINFYRCVQSNPRAVYSLFSTFRNDADTYYGIRAWDRDASYSSMDPVQRAARFLYLNKTCFNGLWRVNVTHGYNNVPYGRPRKVDVSLESLTNLSAAMGSVTFEGMHFKDTLSSAKPGDFAYLDPPYYPVTPTASFTMYVRGDFGHDEQVQLRNECSRLKTCGVRFLLSQSDCEPVRQLYDGFNVETLSVMRTVAARSTSRGKTTEVLITE